MKDSFDIYIEKVKKLGKQYKITDSVDRHINGLVKLSEKYNVPIDDLVCKWFERVFNKGELGYIAYLNLQKELEEQYPDIPQDDILTTDGLIALTTMFYQIDQEKQEKKQAQKDKDKDGEESKKRKREEIPYYVTLLKW